MTQIEAETKTVEASSPVGVSGHSTSSTYSISLNNVRGKCVITWHNSNEFKLAQQGVWLYKDSPPENPLGGHIPGIWVNAQSGTYETVHDWGPGWSAGVAARVYPDNAFKYLAKTPVTS